MTFPIAAAVLSDSQGIQMQRLPNSLLQPVSQSVRPASYKYSLYHLPESGFSGVLATISLDAGRHRLQT